MTFDPSLRKPARWRTAAWLLVATCAGLPVVAGAQASEAQMSAFQKYTTCPSTGRRSGACPGYRIAWKVPPCAGGQDRWTNLVWLTEVAARQKMQSDAAACAASAPRP
ncbi:hypothetical protein [Rhodoferax koreensis]|uniref:hypothetical protein n=1 Tax=Rhodoferax koreensis TaxID=1842727 RepID=UPI0012FF5F61|nr:hypothetical protein [Rhodoferax koreense]